MVAYGTVGANCPLAGMDALMALSPEQISELQQLLAGIAEEAQEIRQDWSDPRSNLRAIMSAVNAAVKILEDAHGPNA